MDFDNQLSCDAFNITSSTSSKSAIDFPSPEAPKEPQLPCDSKSSTLCSTLLSTTSSSSSTISVGYFNQECKTHKKFIPGYGAPNIGYELGFAKTVLQQYSNISGDNLFDHLSDIIKRVIDERPPNIIDFFEEFSRNVREQKLHMPERFPPDGVFDETRLYRVAKKMLMSLHLPITEDRPDLGDEEQLPNEDQKELEIEDLKLNLTEHLFITFNERVQQLQFLWNQCGFSISSDDIFQLACSMNRLQTHPCIVQCRFWGVINGLKKSYYIVEASLTREEIKARLELMAEEMMQKAPEAPARTSEVKQDFLGVSGCDHIGPELIPGMVGWDKYPQEEICKMVPAAAPIPMVEVEEVFDIPPEPIGLGVNRFTYFVVNSIYDDWIELPIATPKQIRVARMIKKFFTGDLEADVISYPCFPGKEKHYLRATISRITAGTYIAPKGYYRRMTKKELKIFEGGEDDDDENEEEEDDDLEGEGEEEEVNNDVMLLRNEHYDKQDLTELNDLSNWVHVRPNILNQGRVVWFNELKAKREREKELARLAKLRKMEEMEFEEEEEEEDLEDEDEGDEEAEEEYNPPEVGPPILSPISMDKSLEYTLPWIATQTSKFTNKKERIEVLRSNVWPGAYTFIFETTCESIYMGWGHKYVHRNMPFKHLNNVVEEYPHGPLDFVEAIDPTPEMEEAYRLSLIKKEKPVDIVGEEMSALDDDDDDDEGDTSEYDEF